MPPVSRHRRKHERIRRRTPPGAAPGTLVPDPHAPAARVQLMCYGPDGLVEQTLDNLRDVPSLLQRWPVTWLNVEGLGDVRRITEVGKIFGLHPLALEDVVNVHQRAKVEAFEDHVFIVVRMPDPAHPFTFEQVSLFVGPRFVVTFQELPGGDCLNPLRQRLRAANTRLRRLGPDHLMHEILDGVIDHYFPMLEEVGERVEQLEQEVLTRPKPRHVTAMHEIKRNLLTMRRAVWPLRDALALLLRDTLPGISPDTRIYLRDCHDHVIQIIDLLENYRDVSSGLTDAYLSSVSHRTNEIMRVLTVISTVFMPLTFIAGVYGMNFRRESSPWNMPELDWHLGYPFALLLMVATAAVFLTYFVRKGWLRSDPLNHNHQDGKQS